jgi:hypothetical protein
MVRRKFFCGPSRASNALALISAQICNLFGGPWFCELVRTRFLDFRRNIQTSIEFVARLVILYSRFGNGMQLVLAHFVLQGDKRRFAGSLFA